MIDLGPHAAYIAAAYLGVCAVTLGLVAAVVLDSRAKRKKLAALEAAREEENKA